MLSTTHVPVLVRQQQHIWRRCHESQALSGLTVHLRIVMQMMLYILFCSYFHPKLQVQPLKVTLSQDFCQCARGPWHAFVSSTAVDA